MRAGIVVSQVIDDLEKLIRKFNSNTLQDSKVYEVLFPDGSLEQYSANIIAESIYNVREDGGCCSLII